MKKLSSAALLIITCLLTFAGRPAADKKPLKAKAKIYVLVHGAWQAPYAWQSVKEQLEKKGQHVIVGEAGIKRVCCHFIKLEWKRVRESELSQRYF